MKKIIYTIIAVISISLSYAQINVQSNINTNISRENPFLDASSYVKFENNEGKGLYFPTTDLTKWEFKTDQINPGKFKTYFDGMIVYNSGTGSTVDDVSKGGVKVNVEPGFYYFYNPNQIAPRGGVSQGRWVRILDKSEELTAKKVTGTFTHQGGTITPELTEMPDANDIKSIVSVRFYRVEETGQDPLDGAVMSTSLYSYKKAEKKAVFGHGPMSVSMPAGKYAYEIVYN